MFGIHDLGPATKAIRSPKETLFTRFAFLLLGFYFSSPFAPCHFSTSLETQSCLLLFNSLGL